MDIIIYASWPLILWSPELDSHGSLVSRSGSNDQYNIPVNIPHDLTSGNGPQEIVCFENAVAPC